MDTKLRNNKKIINLLIACIIILPMFITSSKKFSAYQNNIANQQFLVETMINVCISASDMNYYINEYDGSLKEEAIENEMTYLKNTNKNEFNEVSNEIKNYPEDSDDGYYIHLKQRYDELDGKLKQSDDAYREESIKQIKDILESKYEFLSKNINVEYYIEKTDAEPLTNIKDKSKDDIINETKKDYKYYMMFLNTNNKIPQEIDISKNLNATISDYNIKDIYNNKEVIVRISDPLKVGDEIANRVNEKNSENFKGWIFLILTLLDISIIIFLILKYKKILSSRIKDNFIIRFYKNLFIEIRCLAFWLSIAVLRFMEDVISWGDIINWWDLYILIIIECLLIYLVVSDIRSFNLSNKEINIKNYICEKSLIYKIFIIIRKNFFKIKEFIKESFLIKSTSSRLIIVIIIFIAHQAYLLGYVLPYWYWLDESIKIIPSIIFTLCIIFYMISVARNINKIKIGTENIIKGNYNNKIEIKGSITLNEIASNIMNIEVGLDKAIDKAVKSEKMKSELITNVSHDLKTPLTSIINYIDLIDKESTTEEDKKRYLEILKERSLRLKVLIEDLFEASKAASKTLKLEMENLDLMSLIRQTIGEFENEIEKSKLQFIKNIPEEKLSIYADGKKTFRIFQNLISNILKYSMKNSRVYIDVVEKDEYISVVFKNISKYQLDFTEEEILERFKRGDSSRSTEGSGLGLAIAKSLAELQGGQFAITIDGDLFKVLVCLRKSSK